MHKIKLMTLFICTILVYTAFHISEEAFGNFPLFMQQNWGISNIGYARWLFHNAVFFVPVLVGGLLVYSINEKRMLPFGVGITLWGVINFCEHLFYTIKNSEVSPGTFSSLIFIVLGVLVYLKLRKTEGIGMKTAGLSVLCALLYWGLPLFLIIALSNPVGRLFG
ncbi:MAG TPA: hypothetical protein P5123_07500 [Spirochaetota bacterium]|nr:hypothetical protein [Spirochaetota bacterium]